MAAKLTSSHRVDEDFDESPRLDWHDYLKVLVRRRWSLMGPLFLIGLLGFGVARVWPVLYRSEALILVEQQNVPEQYVTSNVIANLQNRLDSLTQQILSRTRLRALIEEFNLYVEERSRLTMDEVIGNFRENIHIALVQTPGRQGELTGFRISYSAASPNTAQRITNQLTSLFMEENIRARTQMSVSTTSFLENQLEQARADLAAQEQRLSQYKLKYVGELPEQQQGNIQILSSLEAQLRQATASWDRANQQRIYLESQRTQYEALTKSLVEQGQVIKPGPSADAEATLKQLQGQLAQMQSRYSPQHPDMLTLREQITRWQEIRDRLVAEEAAEREAAGTTIAETTQVQPSLIEVESRLKALAVETEAQNREASQLRKRIEEVESRIKLAPVREQQLAEVTRSYENSRENYQTLLQKKLQSELATNLEVRQQGEKFRILDPASLPQKPVSPNRGEIVLFGWLFGIFGGIALLVVREFLDRTIREERHVSEMTEIPVLVRIPVLRSQGEEGRRKRWKFLEAALVGLLIVASISAGVRTYLAS